MRRLPIDQASRGNKTGSPRLDGSTVGNCCRSDATISQNRDTERSHVRLSEEIVHVRTLDREAPSCVAAGFYI
jgi:hypothetical protein